MSFEKAFNFVSALLPALKDLRDLGVIQITPETVRDYTAFKMFANLSSDNRVSKKNQNTIQDFLESLPGYDESVDINAQPKEVTRQFGFSQAYLIRFLDSLCEH